MTQLDTNDSCLMPVRAANISYFWLNILLIAIATSTVPYLLKTDIVTSAILSDLCPRKHRQKPSMHTPSAHFVELYAV